MKTEELDAIERRHQQHLTTWVSSADEIAASRADVPALVAEVRRLRRDLEQMSAEDRFLQREAARAVPLEVERDAALAKAAMLEIELAQTKKDLDAVSIRERAEAHLACDLRASQDEIIERCAKAVDAWPEAAAVLRSHADGISGEDFGELRRERDAALARVAEQDRRIAAMKRAVQQTLKALNVRCACTETPPGPPTCYNCPLDEDNLKHIEEYLDQCRRRAAKFSSAPEQCNHSPGDPS